MHPFSDELGTLIYVRREDDEKQEIRILTSLSRISLRFLVAVVSPIYLEDEVERAGAVRFLLSGQIRSDLNYDFKALYPGRS